MPSSNYLEVKEAVLERLQDRKRRITLHSLLKQIAKKMNLSQVTVKRYVIEMRGSGLIEFSESRVGNILRWHHKERWLN